MDSNLLKVFVAVANNKSISLGAKELEFTQSNVTLRIKQLEKNIGYSLFHRIPKGVKLTHEGEKLYPYAIDIVKKLEDAILHMKNMNHKEVLKVGSTQSNATVRLLPFITNINNEFKDIKIELNINTTPNVLDDLLCYKTDIAFVSGDPKHKDIEVLKSYKEDMYIVEPKSKKTSNTILAYRICCAYFTFHLNHLKSQENNEFKVTVLENYEVILGCVREGMGVSLLPISIINKYNYKDELKLTKVDCDLNTHLICRKDYIPLISEYLKNLDI
jgi:DNA-binding transcriptional LysR family regulator